MSEPEGKVFSEWLLDLHTREVRKLKESKEQVETFRAQGSVGILDVLMRIKEDLRRYQIDLAAGRVNPIVETPQEVVNNELAR